MRTREIMRAARRDGREAGENAASWAFDGNTPHETYVRVLKQLDDGDPAGYDAFRVPNLSGEFADDPTPQTLAANYDLADDDPRAEWLLDELCTAWEDAASSAFWNVIERECRRQVKS